MIEKMMRFLFKKKEKRPPVTWFTSDLHFGHRNVIHYCKRPYKDIDEMTTALIKIWNETVKDGDTVYVLGDFSLNKRWSLEVVPLLKGNKILVSGNHDYTFDFPPKKNSGLSIQQHREKYKGRCNAYVRHGWQNVHQELIVKLSNGTNVLLSHLPYAPKEKEFDTRYLSLRPKDEGMYLLHGHLHCKYRKHGRSIDVGIDGDMKLWSEDEVIALMKDEQEIINTPITEFYKTRNDDRADM